MMALLWVVGAIFALTLVLMFLAAVRHISPWWPGRKADKAQVPPFTMRRLFGGGAVSVWIIAKCTAMQTGNQVVADVAETMTWPCILLGTIYFFNPTLEQWGGLLKTVKPEPRNEFGYGFPVEPTIIPGADQGPPDDLK